MTREEIEKMEASREMDMLIAGMVFKWSDIQDRRRPGGAWFPNGDITGLPSGALCGYQPVTHYSKDISSAWLVVEKMREKGLKFELSDDLFSKMKSVSFCKGPHAITSASESEPLAICRAALIAVMEAK